MCTMTNPSYCNTTTQVYKTYTNGAFCGSYSSYFSLIPFQIMQAARCPTDELSLTNCAVINEKEPQFEQ